MSESYGWAPFEAFAHILGKFERLSAAVDLFIETHEDPQSADMMFAVVRAKEAADHAATLIRRHIRSSHTSSD